VPDSHWLLKKMEYAFWLLGVSILAAYLLLMGQNSLAQSQANDDFMQAKQALKTAQPSAANKVILTASDIDATIDAGFVNTSLNTFEVEAEQTDKSLWSSAFVGHHKNAVNKGGDSAVALLKIPSVNLDVAVFDGADKHNLNRGAARILSTDSVSGNGRIGIAGHRDGWFRPLKDIKIGDIIELESLTETRRYQINKTHIVTPADVAILRGDDHTLVLVTCYPFYFVGSAPQRFIVEAVRLTDKS
jgi:sortase A